MARDIEARRASQRAASAKWYASNQEKQVAANARRRAELMEWWREFKATLRCEECGESHPACLDFHHNDPSQKGGWLHQIGSRGWGKERILAEVAKCRVLCCNCHRKFHWRLMFREVDTQSERG